MAYYLKWGADTGVSTTNNQLLEISGITGTLSSISYTLAEDVPAFGLIRYIYDRRRLLSDPLASGGDSSNILQTAISTFNSTGTSNHKINGITAAAADLFSAVADDVCSFTVGAAPSEGAIAFGGQFNERYHCYGLAVSEITIVDGAGTHVINMDDSGGAGTTLTSDTTNLTATLFNFPGDNSGWVDDGSGPPPEEATFTSSTSSLSSFDANSSVRVTSDVEFGNLVNVVDPVATIDSDVEFGNRVVVVYPYVTTNSDVQFGNLVYITPPVTVLSDVEFGNLVSLTNPFNTVLSDVEFGNLVNTASPFTTVTADVEFGNLVGVINPFTTVAADVEFGNLVYTANPFTTVTADIEFGNSLYVINPHATILADVSFGNLVYTHDPATTVLVDVEFGNLVYTHNPATTTISDVQFGNFVYTHNAFFTTVSNVEFGNHIDFSQSHYTILSDVQFGNAVNNGQNGQTPTAVNTDVKFGNFIEGLSPNAAENLKRLTAAKKNRLQIKRNIYYARRNS